MAASHLIAKSFTFYKNRQVLKQIEKVTFFEIMKNLQQIEKIKFPYLCCVFIVSSQRISTS